MAKPAIGRPSGLTPEVHDLLVEAAGCGLKRQLQADYAGIGKTTLQNWLARGKKEDEGAYFELGVAMRQAMAKKAHKAMSCIDKAIEANDWKAAAWWMQRFHGYTPNGAASDDNEETADVSRFGSRVERLRALVVDARAAMSRAGRTGSHQAVAACLRLVERLEADLEVAIATEAVGDDLDDMASEAFLRGFERNAMDWPDQLLELAINVFAERKGVKVAYSVGS